MRPNYVILIFVYTPQTRRFINLYHVSSNNLKYTNKRHISQTGNYPYNSKLSKDIPFEKKHSVLLKYARKSMKELVEVVFFLKKVNTL